MTIRIKHIACVLLLLVTVGVTSRLTTRAQQNSAPTKSVVTFAEVPTKQSGIAWVHTNAHSSDRHLPETVGAGCAFLDYDNDGWMDIYLVNSGPSDFFTPSIPLKNALYHNNHICTDTEATEKAGVAGGTFGMGIFAADYDGDGWIDLYVTSYGPIILNNNTHAGPSTASPARAGVAAPGWSTGASCSTMTTTANW